MTKNINPFIVTGKIPKAYFCDRDAESAQLIRFLDSQENVVLMSQRRMGKTKLVEHCLESDSREYVLMTSSSAPSATTFLRGMDPRSFSQWLLSQKNLRKSPSGTDCCTSEKNGKSDSNKKRTTGFHCFSCLETTKPCIVIFPVSYFVSSILYNPLDS